MNSQRIIVLSLTVFSAAAAGQQVLREISWEELRKQGKLRVGQVVETNRAVGLEHLNVASPGRGTVYLSPLELVQYAKAGGPFLAGRGGAWWDDRTAGIAGGIAGSIVGLLGGVTGLLAGIGKGRRLVLFLLTLLSLIGGASLAFGLTAVVLSQPYRVYYPPLLLGCLCTILPVFTRGPVRRRFEEIELRKMKAMDAA
ncbi:MAG: hypothetical protein ACYS4W_05160 [Planctomycetota bacterium]|jgi:hypothetical protein